MANQPLFALIDCNNFFASCEQLFRPGLIGKPVVVLSSNDGCVIARSAEAKALGIPMGAPAFKYRDHFKQNGVIQFSANFELYGDISRRITEILTGITPRIEVYSVDESFLDISQLPIKDYQAWALNLRQTIYQWVGMSVSIGVAPTKTLAKLASERAKKDPEHGGAVTILNPEQRQEQLAKTRLEDIWGIGRKFGPRLRTIGMSTALDIANLAPLQGRKILGTVNGEKLVRELNGQSCLPLESIEADHKMISASRTFGQDTSDPGLVEAALASFVARSSQKLRASNLNATRLVIFVSTSRFKGNYRSWGREIILEQPTADTGLLTSLACKLFKEIYIPNTPYHKAGVLLSDFTPKDVLQTDLLGYRNAQTFDRSSRRMAAIDGLKQRYGKPTVYYATEKLGHTWQPKSEIRSPHYTTNWNDLPIVTIK